MRQLIANDIIITVQGVDLTTVTNLEFYVRQGSLFFQYVPTVIDEGTMAVEMPFSDAKKLSKGSCSIQFAWTDSDEKPHAVDPKTLSVGELLKEAGYDPV